MGRWLSVGIRLLSGWDRQYKIMERMITHFSPSVLEPLAAIVEMRIDHGPLEGMYSPKRGGLASRHCMESVLSGLTKQDALLRCLRYWIFDLRGKSGAPELSSEVFAVYSGYSSSCKAGIQPSTMYRVRTEYILHTLTLNSVT